MEGAVENGYSGKTDVDDDGRIKRTGTLFTASAHIITAVIGSGVLSLGWAIAQLGWVAGPFTLMLFSVITWFTSLLLADSYRSPDPVTGKRNHTYMEAVKSNLGGSKVQFCGIAQYVNLVGVTIAFTITGSISMVAIRRSDCFHVEGHNAPCQVSNTNYIAIFAAFQLVLSQIPNFHKLWWLSILAAVMSFTYSFIGIGLSIARIAEGGHDVNTSISGIPIGPNLSAADKLWNIFQSLGDIAAAYTYSIVLVEIQDTLKSTPAESKVMKKASTIGVSTTTIFYMLCGCLGYTAFGHNAPGNFLTGFGFYDPFWLIDIGNICIAIHLIGAYQVFSQPIYQFVETKCRKRWPENRLITKEHVLNIPLYGNYNVNLFRLVWRTSYVVFTAVIAMIFPFFNDFMGLLGALAFWPLTVYFPVEMHIKRAKINRFSFAWVWLQILSIGCLIISVIAGCGSIQGLIQGVRHFKPFSKIN
ncbi:Amino acid permease 6 [Zostera marina]|uniref:Amino acid permease 6 n=1 Tax=Zostera marina TaxID=29655 RepID=A0A0K9PHY7_ZOSMR|nr:Amino acid permease 6 [Zostera marina]